MATIERVAAGEQIPPLQERLLLIVSAAGRPPDAQLIGQSDVEVGYWTGEGFRSMVTDLPSPTVSHWAALSACLPTKIKLRHHRKFDPDVRG
jgi:hypothetical protein